MKDRIHEIIKREHMSNADFAEKIGISPAAVSSILNGRNNPSLDVVTKIHQAYKNLNLEWLLYGKGEMFGSIASISNESQPSLFDENSLNPINHTDVSEYRKEIEVKNADIPTQTIVKQEIKYIEKLQRKITEIRIFFDDNTYEIFKPEK